MDHHHEDDLEADLYNQLSRFIDTDQWERAREVLAKLLAREPESPYCHYQMGHARLQLGQYPQSEHHFKKAISLDPDDPDLYQGMAGLLTIQERYLEAEDYCRQAIRLAPDDAEHWTSMGELCWISGDREQALECLKKAESLAPGSKEVCRLRADIGFMDSLPDSPPDETMLERYQQVLAIDPDDASAHYSCGLIFLFEHEDLEEAERSFRTALRLSPADRDYEKALIETLRKRDPVLNKLWLPLKIAFFAGLALLALLPFFLVVEILRTELLLSVIGLGVFVFLLFWPLTKLYETMTLVEVHRQMGRIPLRKGPLRLFHRLPYSVRFGTFCSLALTFWALVTTLLCRGETGRTIIRGSGTMLVISTLGILLYSVFYFVRDRRRKKKRALQNQSLFDSKIS